MSPAVLGYISFSDVTFLSSYVIRSVAAALFLFVSISVLLVCQAIYLQEWYRLVIGEYLFFPTGRAVIERNIVGGSQDRGRDNQRSWGYNNRRGGGGGGGGGGYYNRDNRDGGYGNKRGSLLSGL